MRITPPSPSAALRRNSLHEADHSYTSLRRSSAALPSSSVRRSATNENTVGSLSRNGSFQDLHNDQSASRSETPNYSRYSSLLEDSHDLGWRTLPRRHSKVGLPPKQ